MTASYRCAWSTKHELETMYHDNEWGVPVHDDQKLFEMLTLESAQSGLSWLTILKKREGYQKAFADFDIEKVAQFDEDKITELLNNPEIVRHKQKIAATINNAKQIIAIQAEYGSFNSYLWGFVNHSPIVNGWKDEAEVPASTPLSEQISKDMKKKGFKFFGPTTCYSFMQAIGMVNDHVEKCFLFETVKNLT